MSSKSLVVVFPSFVSSCTMAMVAMEPESQEGRIKAIPTVSVYDLEKACERFFCSRGSRNLQAYMADVILAGLNWKMAPKVLKDILKQHFKSRLSLNVPQV